METNSVRVTPKVWPWDKVVERFFQLADGGIVKHEELLEISGHDDMTDRHRYIIGKAIRVFRDKTGIVMQSIHGLGYRRPTGTQQLDSGDRKLRFAGRTAVAAVRIAADVTDDRLPDQADRRRRDHQIERMNYIAEIVRTEHRALTATVGTPEVKPQLAVATG